LLRLLTIVAVGLLAVQMGSSHIQIQMSEIASTGCCRFVDGGESGMARRMYGHYRGGFCCLFPLL
jgi:hypothetical protein